LQQWRRSGKSSLQIPRWEPAAGAVDLLNGKIRDARAFTRSGDHRTTVPLELGPRGSLFVVFRKPLEVSKNGAGTRNFPIFPNRRSQGTLDSALRSEIGRT
jgi:hypothetical protein